MDAQEPWDPGGVDGEPTSAEFCSMKELGIQLDPYALTTCHRPKAPRPSVTPLGGISQLQDFLLLSLSQCSSVFLTVTLRDSTLGRAVALYTMEPILIPRIPS